MINQREVTDRLIDARKRHTSGKKMEADGKAQWTKAAKEIEVCMQELETGEPAAPLLDAIERNGQLHAAPGPETARPGPRGPVDYHGRRQRRTDPPDRKLRPSGADADVLARMAKEAGKL
jgi:hypothetical protein